MKNEVVLIGTIVSSLEKFKKDGVSYISFDIETESKYEMNHTITKCLLAGPLIDKVESNNIQEGSFVEVLAHLITDDNTIQIIVDSIDNLETK